MPGSCTVCACALNAERGTLEVANLGDSGLRVLRGGSVVFATKQQEHQVKMCGVVCFVCVCVWVTTEQEHQVSVSGA